MAASLAPSTSSTPATSSGSNLETKSMTPSTGASASAKSGSMSASKAGETPEVVPVEMPAKRERRRDRKSKPKSKPKKETAQCVGYYIDALDKKMLWGEARIIQCNLTTQKIKVHFVGWSKNYDLWTDPMSITAHGRYAPRTKNDKSVKGWDGDMHLFEDMLGPIEETTISPVSVPTEAKPRVSSLPTPAKKNASDKKKASSEKKTLSAKPTVARPPEKATRQPERVAAKRKAAEHTAEKTSLKNAVVTSTSAEKDGHKPEHPRSSKRAAVGTKEKESNPEKLDPTRSSKRQKHEGAQPATATAAPTAKAHTSKKKRSLSPNELPLFRDLELDDGTVLDFSAQREEAREEREAMQSFLEKCALIWKKQLNAFEGLELAQQSAFFEMEETKKTPLRQHPYGNTTPNIQRRYSFSRQAIEAIGQGKHHKNGNTSRGQSPRKTSSFPSMSGKIDSPGCWGELRAHHRENKQEPVKSTAEGQIVSTSTTVSQVDDVSLMLDFNGSSGRFSDDDSDGSSYSSVCSNDENSPAHSSAGSSSVTSSSPLLRQAHSSAGFEALHSEVSEHSSLDSIPRQDTLQEGGMALKDDPKPKFGLDTAVEKQLSPKLSHNKLRATDMNVEDSDDDLPDWLRERVVLSPAASIAKMSARSPQQIENEIRMAVNSAAVRVQQELGRREQFQSAVMSAAAYSPSQATGDSRLFSGIGSDSDRLVSASDDFFGIYNEKEVHPPTSPDFIASDGVQGDLLLVMEVVIGDGRTETIEIHEGDNPDVLASSFAQKHALQPDAVTKLRGLIKDQLNALAETEPEEVVEPAVMVADNWAHNSTSDCFGTSSPNASTFALVSANASFPIDVMKSQMLSHPEPAGTPLQTHDRENHREYSYNNLMARYGHYSQHSGKVDPEGCGDRRSVSSDTHLTRNVQATEYTRVAERLSTSSTAPPFTTMIHTRTNSSKKKANLADAPAYERLHALAESKDKWIQRARKAKELEQARDQERMHRVELMDAKSRELVANRTNGGYAHIGERLHDEALSDIAKKVQRHERRVADREEQQDWMCPKCAFVNQYTDSRCHNIVALAEQSSKTHRGRSPKSSNTLHRDTASSTNSSFGFLESHPEVLCGQLKPDRLFQPTLLTTSTRVMKAVSANKDKSSRVASVRRQRHQHAIEEEFKQTCPFRPKINNVSEEIVREKLDTAAAAAAVHGETRRPRNPHLELYENSFQTRSLREEREEEYFKQFPFKPDIGVNALWVAPDRSQSDFVERLAVDKYNELERKRIALHDKYAPDRDPHTGKELFKPEIGRAPAFSRNKQGLPIGDFLHAAHREQQEYHRQLREKDQREIKKKSQQTFVSEASRQALERRKMDTCVRIFDKLLILSRQSLSSSAPSFSELNPELAKISNLEPQSQQEESSEAVIPAQVNLSSFPAEISRVVAIVFEYANHLPISRDAFSVYMDRLVREVPGVTYSQIIFLAEHLHTDRGGIHRHQLHHSDPEREAALVAAEQKELTFHPVIDKNSREIAMKHGRVSSSKVFHALNQYYDHYLERKEQLRKQQQREFRKAHPFHPTFVTKTRQREPAANAFYDKIRVDNCEDAGNAIMWRAPASVPSAAASYRNAGAPAPPPAPLQTAISNARPCVRPIESERSRFYTAATADEAQLDESSGMSRSSSSSQLLEDAELTSRVLAALDEKPTATSPSPAAVSYLSKALSFSDDASFTGKVGAVRSPEVSDLAALQPSL